MTHAHLTAATIAAVRSLARLDAYARAVALDWGAGRLSDAAAQSLAEAVEARRREVRGVDTLAVRAPHVAALAHGRPSHFPPKRRRARSPDRAASIARRRQLAASGPMPPSLACHFTTGELAALRIVSDAVRASGRCAMTIGEVAARAGVGETTARNALRLAARLGLLTIQERRRQGAPSLANVVRVVSREWLAWLTKGGGCKKTEPTDNHFENRGSRPLPCSPARAVTPGRLGSPMRETARGVT
jgi:hypothetical protein